MNSYILYRKGRYRLFLGLALILNATASHAQDYHVSIAPTGDAMIDRLITDNSRLIGLRERAPVGSFALVTRAEADATRFIEILNGLGYYAAKVQVQVAGHAVDDPALLALLDERPTVAPVTIKIIPGPLYQLGRVELQGAIPDQARAAFTLHPGDPARAADVLAAAAATLNALREDGFALATLSEPDAVVDHGARTLDISYRVEPGPRVTLGAIEVTGLTRLREDAVRRRLGLTPGEPFSPTRLETARRELLANGALAWARLTQATAPDAQGRLPLTLDVAERPLHVLRLGGAYSSDLGASFTSSWTHRNLFGGAEQLTLVGEIGELTANRPDELSAITNATLVLPDVWQRDLNLRLNLGATREFLDAYDRDAATSSVALERRFSNTWSGRTGLAFEMSRITQDGLTQDYHLASLPTSLTFDNTNDPLEPTRGLRLTAQLTPAENLGSDDPGFVLGRVTGSTYIDLARLFTNQTDVGTGRQILAARLTLGNILGAKSGDIPPDWRFYAGGGGSVRGFTFQSIGPETTSGQPAGGDSLLETSVELRSRIGSKWGIAGFVDAGTVSDSGPPGEDMLAVGCGLGVRYFTPIGPVRFDLATPVTERHDQAPVQIYIGIGQAF